MRHYIFIILLQVCCYSCAQQIINAGQLVGTKWKIESPQNVIRTIEFHEDYYTKVTHVSFSEFPEDQYTTKFDFEYYLSNEIPTVFDKKKGKNKKGKYLVGRSNPDNVYNRMWYYTIISFTPQKMVLFEKAEELKEGHIVIGTPPRDVILTLERIYE